MATQATATKTKQDSPKQDTGVQQKIQKMREIYADAPEVGRVALDKILGELEGAIHSQEKIESAGRIGLRRGKVSELTAIVNFAPGGAKRLRALLKLVDGNFQAADKVGTLHDMRFVFLDNDTKLLFATAYDGDWDVYIDDFATKIPDSMDVFFCNMEGWPGIRSPQIKDYLLKMQIPADGWYVASPNLTVAETKRLEKTGAAVEEFLDKVA